MLRASGLKSPLWDAGSAEERMRLPGTCQPRLVTSELLHLGRGLWQAGWRSSIEPGCARFDLSAATSGNVSGEP